MRVRAKLHNIADNNDAFGTSRRGYCCFMLADGVQTPAKDCWTTATPARVSQPPVHHGIRSRTVARLLSVVKLLRLIEEENNENPKKNCKIIFNNEEKEKKKTKEKN